MKKQLCIFLLLSLFLGGSCKNDDHGELPLPGNDASVQVNNGIVTVNPAPCTYAFRNPMKGLREFFGPGYDPVRPEYPEPYGSLVKEYMQWNLLENRATDGTDKIIAYSNHRWKGVEAQNVKVIPRIFIVWMEPWHGGYAKNAHTDNPDDLNGWHWPADLPGETYSDGLTVPITGGYFDPSFPERVKKLVAKAGEAWDNDPRVAYVEMGIIGEWGEHHDPDITTYWAPHDQPEHVANRTWVPGIEKVLGDAFTAAFKNKKVMVRYAYEFKDYSFGIYWDSWAIDEEDVRGYGEMKKLGDRWKTQPVGGEITWNWGSLSRFRSFEEVVGDAAARDKVISQIRDLHANHLGGITWADFNDESFIPNADLLQQTLGYRFVLSDFTYPASIRPGEPFTVAFDVTNTGSSPFYYDWPVEIALLDVSTRQPVWSRTLESARTSQWMPGDTWDNTRKMYTLPAVPCHVEEQLSLDASLPEGNYILSVAVLDPAGMLPSLRFATANYFEGGRHPMGYTGIGKATEQAAIDPASFTDLRKDTSLHYTLTQP